MSKASKVAKDESEQSLIRIANHGAVLVNVANLIQSGAGIVAISIDLRSKHPVIIDAEQGENAPPGLTLGAGKDTLHLDETRPSDSLTTILFPGYVGWRVFAAEVGRYTLSVCLVAPTARKGGIDSKAGSGAA